MEILKNEGIRYTSENHSAAVFVLSCGKEGAHPMAWLFSLIWDRQMAFAWVLNKNFPLGQRNLSDKNLFESRMFQ